jgi:hypothetical protein
MDKHCKRNDDPLIHIYSEFKDGSFVQNAQARSRRRKSRWNLLLPLFALPLFICQLLGAIQLVWLAHVKLHSDHPGTKQHFWAHRTDIYTDVTGFALFVTCVFSTFIITNFLIYLIPPAFRAMEQEDRPYPELNFRKTQISFAKLFAVFLLVLAGLSAFGIATGRLD